ncbi:thiamine biosynthesis bifunctional protein ThiEC [Thermoclostridium stercorarium subsp. stercorarium DSM 8532]|uniref:Thiamine-phosphate synthase n=3 Tax=Thermoclostridium stercorarium TaxID=1510 RepID=L7VTC5_THES1|nr:thiamine phosphate synthase [Thermoclostridium stercorarium]AGC68818.1 thiamine biosynthesis bifunctional protein ThiEC [Thermoclostridium stercorarium subsp. stercorarium DSM 8532]AGI39818.1 thiamine monophosphate synthase [Thermoclostridium stercorarium subsp. stercorarium DSM 8532]ANW99127.1 thiamine phosphate synthase [Thermoclostridium stercorarium subsp. thermolacticum DSM 2910]ANX01691.1 thiamine phosphate synthase [Thermoclostridium stercorarium subsp. leptospartum DSM 9219]UZQ84812
MSIRKNLDISAYLVIGPENTNGRPVKKIIKDAVEAGFTCIQIRSKVASARELIELTREAAEVIALLGKSDNVALLVDDRLDVVLAARKQGIKVDGVHVGQSDIPVDVCREYLGEDSVVGLSARTHEMIEYIKTADVSGIDYFGVGPVHETMTKPDCGLDTDGKIKTRSFEEIAEIVRLSKIPVVVGGGVKVADIPQLARTGAAGFFVVSAVAGADDPKQAALELVNAWKLHTEAGRKN